MKSSLRALKDQSKIDPKWCEWNTPHTQYIIYKVFFFLS